MQLNVIIYLFFAILHHLIEHGMLGQNGTVGQIGTGQNGTIPSYSQKCCILPQCPGPFYPMPIPHMKISVTKVLQWIFDQHAKDFITKKYHLLNAVANELNIHYLSVVVNWYAVHNYTALQKFGII